MNPILKFNNWYQDELKKSSEIIPSACCLSTMGDDGYPNARFVSLKDVLNNRFIITGPLQSRKGQELKTIPKAALTFWWTATRRQVRIQGDCEIIDNTLADRYFAERHIDSQIISRISKQGLPISDYNDLRAHFENEKVSTKDESIARPEGWSGVSIIPKRIEFMNFKDNRFHERELYTYTEGVWTHQLLQP